MHLLPSCFLSLFIFPLLSLHAQTLIDNTCEFSSLRDPAVNYEFCTTSLESASESCHADIIGLGKISIQLTHDNMSDTKSYIKRVLKNEAGLLSSDFKKCLYDCIELYSNSNVDIKNAMNSYKLGHYDEANVLISSVMDAATTCENGFKEKHSVVSPLTKRNNEIYELAAIGLSIMDILRSDD